jgi:hypothetical protein
MMGSWIVPERALPGIENNINHMVERINLGLTMLQKNGPGRINTPLTLFVVKKASKATYNIGMEYANRVRLDSRSICLSNIPSFQPMAT